MFVLYTVAPILYRMASSTYYNLSILSSDFYGLLFGLFLYVRPRHTSERNALTGFLALQAVFFVLYRLSSDGKLFELHLYLKLNDELNPDRWISSLFLVVASGDAGQAGRPHSAVRECAGQWPCGRRRGTPERVNRLFQMVD